MRKGLLGRIPFFHARTRRCKISGGILNGMSVFMPQREEKNEGKNPRAATVIQGITRT